MTETCKLKGSLHHWAWIQVMITDVPHPHTSLCATKYFDHSRCSLHHLPLDGMKGQSIAFLLAFAQPLLPIHRFLLSQQSKALDPLILALTGYFEGEDITFLDSPFGHALSASHIQSCLSLSPQTASFPNLKHNSVWTREKLNMEDTAWLMQNVTKSVDKTSNPYNRFRTLCERGVQKINGHMLLLRLEDRKYWWLN